jgi:glycosyltransferase involved in cell wall biosynthesis
MVKVLHILTRLIRGGADETVLFIVTGLKPCDFEVTLLVGGDSDREYVSQASDEATVLIEPSLRRDVKLLNDLRASYRLYRIIRKGKYDIVHTHTAKAGFIGRLASKMAGVPVIVHTVHGITFHDFRRPIIQTLFITFEKLAAAATDRFIAVGEDLKKHYLQAGIGTPERYTVIHTGMNLERFLNIGELPEKFTQRKRQEFYIKPTDIVIGNVSRLDTGKGQQYLLRAVPQIVARFPNAKFMLVGEGKHRKMFETMVRELHMEQHVIFTGFRYDIEEIIAMFDVAVFTSLWEGLPRVVVQYVTVGKPIVAFDIKGVRELVRNGINGFTVPVKDVALLAKRIIYMLENLENSKNMGKSGRQLVDHTWRADFMVAQIAQEYQLLLGEKGRE